MSKSLENLRKIVHGFGIVVTHVHIVYILAIVPVNLLIFDRQSDNYIRSFALLYIMDKYCQLWKNHGIMFPSSCGYPEQ